MSDLLQRLPKLEPFIERHIPTGSRRICSPAPTNTDEDWLILRKGDFNAFVACAEAYGFEVDGSVVEDPQSHRENTSAFFSLKRQSDKLNLIVTPSQHFYDRFFAATYVAMRLNLLKKNDRICLFQAVLYGNIWSE